MQDDQSRASGARGREPTEELPVPAHVEASETGRISAQKPARRRALDVLVGRWDVLAVIAVGGALGSLGRWAIGQALAAPRGAFPWATFIENVSGGFALGVLMVFVLDVWPPSRYVRPFFAVGVLGGYTTFSTYMLDARELVAADQALRAAAYLFGTLVVGLFAVWAGLVLARLLVERRKRRHGGDQVADPTPRARSDS